MRIRRPSADWVKAWSYTADGEGRTLAGHTGFAADGRVLVTLGFEGTVRARPDDLPETIPALRAWLSAATADHTR